MCAAVRSAQPAHELVVSVIAPALLVREALAIVRVRAIGLVEATLAIALAVAEAILAIDRASSPAEVIASAAAMFRGAVAEAVHSAAAPIDSAAPARAPAAAAARRA
jgi:hypothetical protein